MGTQDGGVTKRSGRQSYLGAGTVLVAGLAATAVAFLATSQQQAKVSQLAFDKTAYDHIEAIREAIENKVQILRSTQAFFEVSGEVTSASFRDFVKPFLSQTKGIQALEWIPRVGHDQRAEFEKTVRATGPKDFEIRVREHQGHMVSSPPQAEYFPVRYIEPLVNNEAALGFDLASNPDRRSAIDQARTLEGPTATGGITLVQEKEGQIGILLFMPVHAPGGSEAPETLRGFVLGVFRVGDMAEAALQRLHGCTTHVAIMDLDAPEPHRFLYMHSGSAATRGDWDARGLAPKVAGIAPKEAVIPVGGRRWQIVCVASKAFSAGTAWAPWAVLAAGTILAFLTSGYVFRLSGESSRLSQAVATATEELSGSQARYQAIVEDQIDLVCRFRPNGRLTFVNRAYASFYGKSPEQMDGIDWQTLVPESVAHQSKRLLAELTPLNPIVFHEHEVIAADGQTRWHRWTNCALYDEGGNLREYQAIGHDITEIHLARKSVAESQARYRAIVEDQTELVCRFGSDFVLTFVNQAYARYWGKTPEEMIGVDWRTLVPEEIRPSLGNHLVLLTPESPTATLEHEVLDAGGQIRWQQWTDHAIFNGDGSVREFQSVGRDITERRHAELQVAKERALLRSLIDSIPDVIFFKDAHGRYLGCNPAFEQYACRTQSQIVGLTDWDLFPPDIAEAYIANDQAMLSGGKPRQNEEWIEFPDGARILLDTLKTPYYGPNRQVLGMIGICRDITRAREAEQAIVDVHRRLLNAREEERRRIAEELHESICQDMAALQMFLTPLSGSETAVPADKDRALLASAAGMCKAVLEKSRNICYDLYPPVLAGLGLAAGLKSLSQTPDFAPKDIRVTADASYEQGAPVTGLARIAFYRTAHEAVNNAIRHGRAERIDVLLSRRDGHVVLQVIDDGNGFDPQSRREGLGLTLMRERMLAVGGEVEFASSSGRTAVTARVSEQAATRTTPDAADSLPK